MSSSSASWFGVSTLTWRLTSKEEETRVFPISQPCADSHNTCWRTISDVLKRSLNCLWEIKSVGKTYCKIVLKVISCHVVSAGVLLGQIYNGNWWIKTRQFEFSLKRRSEFVQLSVNGDELSHKGILLCQQNHFRLLNFFSSLKTPRKLACLQPISLIDKKSFHFDTALLNPKLEGPYYHVHSITDRWQCLRDQTSLLVQKKEQKTFLSSKMIAFSIGTQKPEVLQKSFLL